MKIPKGNKIFTPCGHSKWSNLYKDPREFKPERFDKEVPKLERYTYIPFYDGRRKCLGYTLGETNMKMLIGGMIKNFEFEIKNDYEIIMEAHGPYQVINPFIQIK